MLAYAEYFFTEYFLQNTFHRLLLLTDDNFQYPDGSA